MENPLVTVLITAYNSTHLNEAIKSIDAQKYTPIEILIIDDGSNPPMRESIINVSKHKLRYIFMEHKGLPYGLIKGLEESKGKYVAILDHDNVLTEDSISSRVQAFQENESLGLVYGDIAYINSEDEHYLTQKFNDPKSNSEFIREILINKIPPIEHNTIMFNRELINSLGGYNPNSQCYFDLELIIKIAEKYPIKHLSCEVVKYRTHSKNFSGKTSYQIGSLKKKIKLIDKHLHSPYKNINHKILVLGKDTFTMIHSKIARSWPNFIFKNKKYK